MPKPVLAPAFCQIAWVVRDLAAAEKFFVETMGISHFMHLDNLAAKDTEGTYLGKPGNWVCNLHVAYAGDTQIELIQPVSGLACTRSHLIDMVTPFSTWRTGWTMPTMTPQPLTWNLRAIP